MMSIVHPSDMPALKEDLKMIANGLQDSHEMDYRWINRTGDIVWVNCRGKVLYDENGLPAIMVGRVSEEALRHLFNPLTGLWNKPKLKLDLTELLKKGSGYLMMLDIDSLASINLTHGRDYIDQLLKDVAHILDSHPSVEKAYHIDHNNFAVVVNDDSETEVKAVHDDVTESVHEKCTFTASAVPIDNDVFTDTSNLLDSINITLKKAKKKSKSRLEFFSMDDIRERIIYLALLEELKESIQNGFTEFDIQYQPQIDSKTFELYGVEALLRYNSNTRGFVSPAEFIPVLEQTGLIDDVGLWVLKQALTQCKKWREKMPQLKVSVNFSTSQFEDIFITEKIINILKTAEMSGDALTIEITESIQLHESERFRYHITALKSYGIHFSIDDFGTGYSNLGYIKQLDIDELEIDRTFVSNLTENTYNYNLISNVTEFAKTNSIRICCEGVETIREFSVLQTLKPDIYQGFLFNKPCNASYIDEAYMDPQSEKYAKRQNFINKMIKFSR